jgi:hypothetical protein
MAASSRVRQGDTGLQRLAVPPRWLRFITLSRRAGERGLLRRAQGGPRACSAGAPRPSDDRRCLLACGACSHRGSAGAAPRAVAMDTRTRHRRYDVRLRCHGREPRIHRGRNCVRAGKQSAPAGGGTGGVAARRANRPGGVRRSGPGPCGCRPGGVSGDIRVGRRWADRAAAGAGIQWWTRRRQRDRQARRARLTLAAWPLVLGSIPLSSPR